MSRAPHPELVEHARREDEFASFCRWLMSETSQEPDPVDIGLTYLAVEHLVFVSAFDRGDP